MSVLEFITVVLIIKKVSFAISILSQDKTPKLRKQELVKGVERSSGKWDKPGRHCSV